MTKVDGSQSKELILCRIADAESKLEPRVREPAPVAGMQLGWRMVSDLVAGVGVGAAIGFGLDSIFGIAPICLATFTLLGFAAGVNLMLRSARQFEAKIAEQLEK